MSSPRRLLDDGEELVHELHPHWWALSGAAALVALLTGATVALWSLDVSEWLQLLGATATLVATVRLVGRYLRWASSRLLLTTDRLVVRDGVVARHAQEVPLHLVTAVSVRQSLRQRLLRSGDLHLHLAAPRGDHVVVDVPTVQVVRAEVARLLRRRGLAVPARGDDRTAVWPAG